MPNQTCCACGGKTYGAHTRITDQNRAGIVWAFEVTQRAGGDQLQVGGFLCRKPRMMVGGRGKKGGQTQAKAPCLSEEEAATVERLMVGKAVAMHFPRKQNQPTGDPTRFYHGTVFELVARPSSVEELTDAVALTLVYKVTFTSAPELHREKTMTQSEVVAAHDDHLALQLTLTHEQELALRRERRRSIDAAPVPLAAEDGGGVGDALTRGLTCDNIWDPEWWDEYGKKVSPTLHTHLFGFKGPRRMLHFFDTFFETEMGGEKLLGLSPCQMAAIALWRMRCVVGSG